MNYKRKKSKRQVRCTGCTEHRWRGNAVGRFKPQDEVVEPSPSKLTPPKPKKKFAFVIEAKVRPDLDGPRGFHGWYHKHFGDWKTYRRYVRERSAEQSLETLRRGVLDRVLEFRIARVA